MKLEDLEFTLKELDRNKIYIASIEDSVLYTMTSEQVEKFIMLFHEIGIDLIIVPKSVNISELTEFLENNGCKDDDFDNNLVV